MAMQNGLSVFESIFIVPEEKTNKSKQKKKVGITSQNLLDKGDDVYGKLLSDSGADRHIMKMKMLLNGEEVSLDSNTRDAIVSYIELLRAQANDIFHEKTVTAAHKIFNALLNAVEKSS